MMKRCQFWWKSSSFYYFEIKLKGLKKKKRDSWKNTLFNYQPSSPTSLLFGAMQLLRYFGFCMRFVEFSSILPFLFLFVDQCFGLFNKYVFDLFNFLKGPENNSVSPTVLFFFFISKKNGVALFYFSLAFEQNF